TPRLLYGGWTGSGSDPDLKPETSRTFELSVGRRARKVSGALSAFVVRNHDTIVNTSAGAQNVADRRVAGFDLQLQAQLAPPVLRKLKLWGFYSRLLEAEERA